jgi:hypothetical protein
MFIRTETSVVSVRDSLSVGIKIGYGLGDEEVRPVLAHRTPYPMGTGGSFPRGKAAEA